MRSRPKVKLFLKPGVATPGQRLAAEVVLVSKSDRTPIDYVDIHLSGVMRLGLRSGQSAQVRSVRLLDQAWRSKPFELSRGEERLSCFFDVPADLPASYDGADADIRYTISVHVAIPWWPDRITTFLVPVMLPPVPSPPEPVPKTFATSSDGPRGTDAFIELSLDTIHLSVGDVLTGSVSLQNLRGRRVRGVDISFVEVETLTVLPRQWSTPAQRFTMRLLDGAPREGETIPFRVRVPDGATPTFHVAAAGGAQLVRAVPPSLAVGTYVEVRALVSWASGGDVVLRAPIVVARRSMAPRAKTGWVAPVGRTRQALVWQIAATQLGLVVDPEAERMTGQRGAVTIEIGAERREDDTFMTAKLGWPSLGIDLEVSEKRWTDAIALGSRSGDPAVDGRFRVRAREQAQAAPLLEVFAMMTQLDDVRIDDTGARLAVRGAPHSSTKLEPFAARVLDVAAALDAAIRRIPPPAVFAADVPAWEAAAARLRGRLELGRMWIREGRVGTDTVEIGTTWARSGVLLGSVVHVKIDPPLESAPTSLDDPALSPAARDAWRELAAHANDVRIEPRSISVDLEGKLSDPQTAMPAVELAVSLRRALAGMRAAGPFR